jgi:hypothetical protein
MKDQGILIWNMQEPVDFLQYYFNIIQKHTLFGSFLPIAAPMANNFFKYFLNYTIWKGLPNLISY